MSYLVDLQGKLNQRDYSGFLQLWEEYCHGDDLDPHELLGILKVVKASDFVAPFNAQLPSVLTLWENITDPEASYQVFRLILDIQNTNPIEMAEMAIELLKKRFKSLSDFNEKLRLVGLRNKENFRGAISNFELLNHMAKGKFVFHTGGWGTGEIIDLSLLREELVLEFEQVAGRKDLSFENAFKNLIPLPDDHFLARRFGHADALEEEARKDPVGVIRLLLKDLGSKTAAEIKDELCEWVIPEEEWSKWWQSTRSKVKKDTLIASPATLKEPFRLRTSELSHEERFSKLLQEKKGVAETLDFIYQQLRDFSQLSKSANLVASTNQRLKEFLEEPLSEAFRLQIYFLQEDLGIAAKEAITSMIQSLNDPAALVEELAIAAYKKKALVAVRELRNDWEEIFTKLFFGMPHPVLRDYLLKELNQPATLSNLNKSLERLLAAPQQSPELLVWYFQKIVSEPKLPFGDKEGLCRFFEAFLTLMPLIEPNPAHRDLVKKMHTIISHKRFAVVRTIIEGTSLPYLQEILLLVSKCQSLSDHDVKILHSLAEVVQPTLAKEGRTRANGAAEEVVWTTKEGYQKIQMRIQHIGTVETIENAREIEAARAHGDLRENSEYKFALERRARLQGELKSLSIQINRARLITQQDIAKDEVGVGSIVTMKNSQGQTNRYTLLGPWDADPENNVLSFQSKLAQTMIGKKIGETFQFQDEEYTVVEITSYLE